jgi:hypothetical protein
MQSLTPGLSSGYINKRKKSGIYAGSGENVKGASRKGIKFQPYNLKRR